MSSNNKKFGRYSFKRFSAILASTLVGTNLVSLLVGTNSALALGNEINAQTSSITDSILNLDKVSNGGFDNNFKSSKQNWEYKDKGKGQLITENNNSYGLIKAGSIDDYILQVVSTTPGKKYTVSADIKVTEAVEGKTPGSVFFTAKRQTEAGKQGTVYKQLEFTAKTNGWERKEFEFTADTYKTYIGIVKWIEKDINGNVSATEIGIDNVKVIEEDNSTVLWEESFSGDVLNQDIWGYELGNIRGNEQQHYSSSKENVFMRDGNLVLKVTDRPEEDQYRNTEKHNNNARLVKYNSGSVRTQGNQEFLYGRIEAKMKLPKGKGAFPAFWTLGSDFHMDGRINTNQGYDWPSVGEIDIMEIIGAPTEAEIAKGEVGKVGNSNSKAYGTPHFYYVNGDLDKDGSYEPTELGGNVSINEDFYNDYHVFGINWTPNKIEWYVDGVVYNTMHFSDPTNPVNDARLKAAAKSLNRPQYIQFNLATGGNWAGDAGDYLAGQELDIDWVRYLQNDEQKVASAEYYATQPVLSGVKNVTMIEGQQPNLLENVSVNLDNHIIDYTVENEQMFVNGGAEDGRNEVTIQVQNAADSASLKQLKPGVYNIHYTAMPEGANINGWVTPAAKLDRETAILTVLPNGGLVGNEGEVLSTVTLPAGWSWENPNEIIGSKDSYGVIFTNANDTTVAAENRRTFNIDIPKEFITENPTEVEQEETVIAEVNNIKLDGTRDTATAASKDLQDKIQEVMSMGKGTITFRYSLDEAESVVRTSSLMQFMTIGNKDNQLEYASFYLRTKDNKIGVEVRNKNGQRDYLRQVGSGFNLISNADWHTVSYVFNGTNMKVYLDGDLYGETDFSGLLSDASWKAGANNITIGGFIRGNQWQEGSFKGAMNKVIIDNDVLSKDEILKLHEVTSRAYEGEKLSMWDKFDEDIFEYRIPSIVKTPQGTVVAASDARKKHYNDWGDISTVVRVSNDNGRTWSENITVLDMPTQPYYTKDYSTNDWNTNHNQSAFSIDPILLTDSTGKIYMLVDVFPESQGAINSREGSGYELIDGKYYLNLYDFSKNKYTVREDGNVYDSQGRKTNMYVSEGEFETAFSTKGDLYRRESDGTNTRLGNIYLRSGRDATGVTKTGSDTAPLFTHMTGFLWLFTSDDQGQTWSKPVDITGSVKESWMGFIGTGAGTGIEVKAKNEAGESINRLMFPIYYTNQQGATASTLGRQSSANLYSDDGGLTWHRAESPNDGRIYGNGKQTNSKDFNTAVTELTENQIVQLNNGHLLQFMRNTGKTVMIAKSTDYGKTWEDALIDSGIPEPYVNLSAIHMEVDGKEYIVLSNPTGNPDAEENDFRTRNLRMKGALRVGEVQADDSIKWVASKVYEPKRFAYSSLVQLDSEKVGVLYEYDGHIKYSIFNIKEMITEGNRFDISYIESVTKEIKKAEGNTEEGIQAKDEIIFTVKANQNLFMIGNGKLNINIGNASKTANYLSGNGTDTFTFAYTVQEGDAGQIATSGEVQNATLESVYNIPLKSEGETYSLGFIGDVVIGSNISEMFNNKYSDNTWVFTGGSAVQGSYKQSQGIRNYVAQFEEYIRWAKAGEEENGRQRFVINTAKENNTLKDIVDSFDEYVGQYSPKAVAYMIGEEDYLQGEENLNNFKESLKALIDKSLALHNNGGFVVIETPFATNDNACNEIIKKYSEAANDVIKQYINTNAINNIVLVDHYSLTNNDDFKTNMLNDNNTLNAKGHYEIGKQLSQGTIKTTDGYPGNNVKLDLVAVPAPNTYLKAQPTAIYRDNKLVVSIPEVEGINEWKYMVKINGDTISDVVSTNEFQISNLPKDQAYELKIQSSDGEKQLITVQGKTTDNNEGAKKLQELDAKQQLIKDAMDNNDKLTWLFMGDSITHGALWTFGYDSITQSFEKFLHNDLQRQGDVVINTAVSGATVASTLAQIDERLEKYNPDVISIMLGTNDAGNNKLTAEQYKAQLQQLVDKAKEKNAIIILRTPTPSTHGNKETRVPELMEKMKEVAEENDNIIFIDQYTELNEMFNKYPFLWEPEYSIITDGFPLHPGPNGQLLLTRMFIKGSGLWTDDSYITNLFYEMPITDEVIEVTPEIEVTDNGVQLSVDALVKQIKSQKSRVQLFIDALTQKDESEIENVVLTAKQKEGNKEYKTSGNSGILSLNNLDDNYVYKIEVEVYLKGQPTKLDFVTKEIPFNIKENEEDVNTGDEEKNTTDPQEIDKDNTSDEKASEVKNEIDANKQDVKNVSGNEKLEAENEYNSANLPKTGGENSAIIFILAVSAIIGSTFFLKESK